MSRPHHAPALRLQLALPFGFEVVRFGPLGVHANAFSHGVFDDVDRSFWFHVPVGIPASCVMHTMARTEKQLSGARVATIDVGALSPARHA